jgi:hypothetical protein
VNLTSLRHRIYADFLMPSRLGAYRRLLELALGAGYRVVSIETFWQLIVGNAVDPGEPYLVLRHDIDTDPATARAMWAIERGLGVESSYYFRLSTTDLGLMRDIAEGGSHASYHYEELATIAKQWRLRRATDVLAHLPEARARFQENLGRLRASTGLPMRVVASHGDFVNRAVGVANRAILEDPGFRHEVGVDLEVYDEAFVGQLTSRYSDTHHPRYWVSADPQAGIARGEAVIQVLVHPRHWRVHRLVNAADDVRRVAEGLAYRLPSRPADPIGRRPEPRAGTPPGRDPDVPAR